MGVLDHTWTAARICRTLPKLERWLLPESRVGLQTAITFASCGFGGKLGLSGLTVSMCEVVDESEFDVRHDGSRI